MEQSLEPVSTEYWSVRKPEGTAEGSRKMSGATCTTDELYALMARTTSLEIENIQQTVSGKVHENQR